MVGAECIGHKPWLFPTNVIYCSWVITQRFWYVTMMKNSLALIVAAVGLSIPAWAVVEGEIALRPSKNDDIAYRLLPSFYDRLPRMHYTPNAKIQAVSYTVFDSLFNAFSYYGSNQTCVWWDSQTNAFITIKRGALVSRADNPSPDKSNNIFIVWTTDNGQTWQRMGPVIVGNLVEGLPRYPSIALIRSDVTIATLDNSIFNFYCPVTDGSSWVGMIAGYVPNAIGASATTIKLTDYRDQQTNYSYSFGTTYSTSSITRDPETAFGFMLTGLIPTAASGAPLNENNNIGMVTTDFSPTALETFAVTIPSSLRSNKFVAPTQANTRTNSEVGLDVDAENNLYAGVFGSFITPDGGNVPLTFGVTKSTDNGKTWSEANVLPQSVIQAYATANGGDPSTSGFRFSWTWLGDAAGNTPVTSAKDFVVTGVDSYSFAAQFALLQGQSLLGVHYVEVYYENGQWGIRKIADASVFEANAQMRFNNGDNYGPSQLGCELQLVRSADYNFLLFKTLEARLIIWGGDTLITTDVVVSARPKNGTAWEVLRNVTQSLIFDRITWIPKVIPASAENIPLLTVQAAYRGSTDREYYWDNQFLLASATQDPTQEEIIRYRQYVTYSTFNYESLPEWNPETAVGSQVTRSMAISIAPNPANSEVTVYRPDALSRATLDIVNARGEVVYHAMFQRGESFHTFNAANLASGFYQCIVRSEDGTIVSPLCIIR